jgi:hypothetical protein
MSYWPPEDFARHFAARGVAFRRDERGGFVLRCPSCDHKRPKLSVHFNSSGRPLIHCASGRGCDSNAICAALEIPSRAVSPYTRTVLARNTSAPESLGVVNLDELLALFARGELRPDPRASVPELPKGARRLIREVLVFFVLCEGLRLTVKGKLTIPFAPGWVAGHLGEDKRNVARAIKWLVDREVIVRDGELPRVWKHPETKVEYRQQDDRPRGCVVKHPGAKCYRLSDLRRARHVPARTRPVERTPSVAVVGNVEPAGEVREDAGVRPTEPIDIADRLLGTVEGSAGRLALDRLSEPAPDAVVGRDGHG